MVNQNSKVVKTLKVKSGRNYHKWAGRKSKVKSDCQCSRTFKCFIHADPADLVNEG